MSDFFKDDPLYQAGKRYPQQGMDRTLDKYRQFGAHERMLQNRIFHFLTIGLIKFLWNWSRTALFVYVIPFWLYVFSWIGVAGATSSSRDGDSLGAVIGFGSFGGLCLLLMAGSMWYGLQKTTGFCRVVSILQMALASCFAAVATYRAIITPPSDYPYKPESAECGIAMALMFLFFVVTLIADLVRGFMDRRAGA